MKTQTTKLLMMLIGLSISFSACKEINIILPSETVTTQEKFVQNYSGLEVSTAFTVDVQFSDTDERIEVEANENLHPFIVVEKVNNTLRIKLKKGIQVRGNSTLKIHIVTKNNKDYYAASGASHIILMDSLLSDNVTISLSGASTFSGTISVNSLSAFIDGASSASLSGTTSSLSAHLSGASTLRDFDMITQHADLDLSGASQSNLTVNNTIDLSASGASVFKYKGSATIGQLNLSGVSQIMKVN